MKIGGLVGKKMKNIRFAVKKTTSVFLCLLLAACVNEQYAASDDEWGDAGGFETFKPRKTAAVTDQRSEQESLEHRRKTKALEMRQAEEEAQLEAQNMARTLAVKLAQVKAQELAQESNQPPAQKGAQKPVPDQEQASKVDEESSEQKSQRLAQRLAKQLARVRSQKRTGNSTQVQQKEKATKTSSRLPLPGMEVVQVSRGNGQFINRRPATAPAYIEKEWDITLNFESSPITEVAKTILNDILHVNYSIDENISGNVSMRTTQPISRDALISTLESLLRLNDAALIKNEDYFEVVSLKGDTLPGSISASTSLDPKKAYQVLIVPLKYIGAEAMGKILEPVKTEKSKVIVDDYRNILMLSGTHRELVNLRETISLFDVDQLAGKSVGLYRLSNADAGAVFNELALIFGDDASGPLAGLVKFTALERLNAILIVTTQRKYLRDAERWIERLDHSGGIHGANMYVYHVQHGKAEHLAEILTRLFDNNRKTDLRKASGSTLSKSISQSKIKPKARVSSTANKARSLDVGDVTIIADVENNALVILGTPSDYKEIEKALKKLDVLPLQVLVEASIVEVNLEEELQHGLQWFFKNGGGRFDGVGGLNMPPSGSVTAPTTTPVSGTATGGLAGALAAPVNFTYALFDAASTRAVLNVIAGDSRLNVLSSPSLMVLDNHKATIRVGDQVPVRTSESTNTASDNLNVTSQIQYRDTGVTLEVTPRVNAGGTIIMELTLRVDDVDTTNTSSIDSPTILQREITSNIAVQSGETIVIGGLIKNSEEISKRGIPVLKDIPYLGALFSGTEKLKGKTELVVMIKPIAVNSSAEAKNVTEEYRNKMKNIDFGYFD